jgi:excisionase family DNA binding protein
MLTVQEVADRLRVSAQTVRRLIEDGELIAHRIGQQLRIAEEDLQAYLDRTVVRPVAGDAPGSH